LQRNIRENEEIKENQPVSQLSNVKTVKPRQHRNEDGNRPEYDELTKEIDKVLSESSKKVGWKRYVSTSMIAKLRPIHFSNLACNIIIGFVW